MSIDLREPPSTGISAFDRAACIRRASSPDAKADEFKRPGHVFPLRAHPGGVIERGGHAEAAVDLARLAGLQPAGAICEIMNADGTMARPPDLLRSRALTACSWSPSPTSSRISFGATRWSDGKPRPTSPRRTASFALWGSPLLTTALVHADREQACDELVAVHVECLTGDAFGRLRCGWAEQMDEAMRAVAVEGRGVIVYVRRRKEQALDLAHSAWPSDANDVSLVAQILLDLSIERIRLLSDDGAEADVLEGSGVHVVEEIPLAPQVRELRSKRGELDHVLLSYNRYEVMA